MLSAIFLDVYLALFWKVKPGTFSGYWLEVLNYADQGNNSKTKELIHGVVEKDWDTNSETQARASLLQLQDKLMAIREDVNLRISETVEAAGVKLVIPAMTVYVKELPVTQSG